MTPEVSSSFSTLTEFELADGQHALMLDVQSRITMTVMGLSGTGKTTTVGKLARVLVADGRRVVLGAADTFRAAAADQLQAWASRVGACADKT